MYVYFLYIRKYILTLFLSSASLDPGFILIISIETICLIFMLSKHSKIVLQAEQQLCDHRKLEQCPKNLLRFGFVFKD